MPTMQQWFDAYGESHQNPTNKLIHWICVPLIFYSIIGLLASIPADWMKDLFPLAMQPYVHWGTVLVLIGLIFYLMHSITILIGIMLYSALCLLAVTWFSQLPMPLWQSSLIIFVAAWIGQFYGHKVEGKKPSFFQDLKFLLIGPAWLMHFVYMKLGIRY
jgi:uncharacterized membrane protein YGL010W